MIPHGFIQELLSRVDIVDVVGRHVELKKAGINHKGLCPFHGEKSPSFIVSPTRQTYHCFGCGAHGDVFTYVQTQRGVTFREALRDLAREAGGSLREDPAIEKERAVKAERASMLRRAAELIEWDERVCMPRGGAPIHGEMQATLRRLAHEAFTRDEMNLLIQEIWMETRKTIAFVTHSSAKSSMR